MSAYESDPLWNALNALGYPVAISVLIDEHDQQDALGRHARVVLARLMMRDRQPGLLCTLKSLSMGHLTWQSESFSSSRCSL